MVQLIKNISAVLKIALVIIADGELIFNKIRDAVKAHKEKEKAENADAKTKNN
jgi:hypothetical protein